MATHVPKRRKIVSDPITAGWEKPPIAWRFDDLTRSYNFPHDQSNRVSMMCSFIRSEAESRGEGIRGLDIGCGVGIAMRPDATVAVARCFSEIWGVEPDESVEHPPIFSRVERAAFETAELPEGHFNVAYSYMVMEHVANPALFMSKLYRTLAPGGCYLFLTVNGAHYFSRVANALRAIGLDELALRLLFGEQLVAGYHYPTQYRFNQPSQIDSVCEATGFEKPEYVYVERTGRMAYIKGPLTMLGNHLHRSRLKDKRRERLLDLYCRVRKPG